MSRRRTRALTSAGLAGTLGLALVATGVVALPGSAAASGIETWTIDGQPDPFDRYTARVDAEHLSGDTVVRPGPDAEERAALLDAATEAAPGQFDPQEVLRAAELVGAPAALGSVGGVLRLHGPRGVVVLGDGPAELQAPGGGTEGDSSPVAYAVPHTSPDAVSPALLARLAAAPGVESAVPLHGGLVQLTVRRGAPAPSGLDGVSEVERDPEGRVADLAGLPDDPGMARSWALHNAGGLLPGTGVVAVPGADLGALGAWPRTRGAGVTVAVVDTGYAPHRDLAGALWTNDGESCSDGADADGNDYPSDCHGWNFYEGSNDVVNASGPGSNLHGTLVASVIAGAVGDGHGMGGIAPDVEIMPLVVGAGGGIPLSAVVEAVYYAADEGADVINMSLVGDWAGTWAGDRLEAAMEYATDRGVLVVAAAGNDERGGGEGDRDRYPLLPASSPNPGVLTVGASTARDELAGFSGWGQHAVDVFAPGTWVLAANSSQGVEYASGTSLASPLAAGVAALLKSVDPSLDGTALRRRIIDSAARLPALAGRGVSGRVDARAALATVPTPLQVDVDGLDSLRPDATGSAVVRLSGDGSGLPDGPLGMTVSLRTVADDGQVHAVADAPVDAGAAGSALTDDVGSVALAPAGLTRSGLAGGVAVPLSTQLPEGRYAVLVELTSGGQAVGGRSAVPFVVGQPAVVAPPAPSAPPSWQPVSGPTSPAASPRPSTPPTAPSPPTAPPAPSAPSAPTTPALPPAPAQPAPSAPVAPVLPPVGPAPTTPSRPDPLPSTPALPELPAPTSPRPVPPAPTAPDPVAPDPVAPAPGAPTPGAAAPVPPADRPVDDPVFGISRVSPGTGSVEGGQLVTLHGTHLPARPAVLFGGVTAEVVRVDAPSSITVRTPARAAGAVDVTVFDTASADLSGERRSAVLGGAFSYVDATSPVPTAAPPAPAPTAPSTRAPSPAPPVPAPPAPAPTAPSTRAPSPAPSAPAWSGPSPSPSPLRTSTPGVRGGLRLVPVHDVDRTLFGHATCGATCTALRL